MSKIHFTIDERNGGYIRTPYTIVRINIFYILYALVSLNINYFNNDFYKKYSRMKIKSMHIINIYTLRMFNCDIYY